MVISFQLYFFQIPPATTHPLSNSTESNPQHITGKDNLITPQQALQNLKQSTINKSPLKEKTLTDELAVESEGKSDDKPTKRTTLSGKSLTSSTKIRKEERG